MSVRNKIGAYKLFLDTLYMKTKSGASINMSTLQSAFGISTNTGSALRHLSIAAYKTPNGSNRGPGGTWTWVGSMPSDQMAEELCAWLNNYSKAKYEAKKAAQKQTDLDKFNEREGVEDAKKSTIFVKNGTEAANIDLKHVRPGVPLLADLLDTNKEILAEMKRMNEKLSEIKSSKKKSFFN